MPYATKQGRDLKWACICGNPDTSKSCRVQNRCTHKRAVVLWSGLGWVSHDRTANGVECHGCGREWKTHEEFLKDLNARD